MMIGQTGAEADLEHIPTILLAEDEALIRWVIADDLRERGWKVIEVGSADEGIAVLRTASIDLVITDIHMPGTTNGLGLALAASEFPGVHVVLMSGVSPSLIEGFQTPPRYDLFLHKPFDTAAMIERLESLLGGTRTRGEPFTTDDDFL